MMKRLIATGSALLLLAACGGGGRAQCAQDYWDGVVGTCLPEGWAVVDRETLSQRGVPEETIIAFRTEESVSGQFPTIAVTQESLANADEVTASAYSEASIRSVSVLPGYALLDAKVHTIDGEKVSLHVFSGQPIESEPGRRFYQISTVKGNIGYTITAAVPLFIEKDLESQIQLILNEMTFEGEE